MTENIYEPPKAELWKDGEANSQCHFFPSSTNKLIILFISTFGLYTVYWFYKNWKIQQNQIQKKIRPALRSLFYIFFTHALFSRIGESAQAKEIPTKLNYNLLATLLVIFSIITNILDRFSMNSETLGLIDLIGIIVMLLMLMPLYYIQNSVNEINNDPDGELNSSFSIYNYIFIVPGAILWLFIVIGFFIE